jgi:hypothetical protein
MHFGSIATKRHVRDASGSPADLPLSGRGAHEKTTAQMDAGREAGAMSRSSGADLYSEKVENHPVGAREP